METNNTKGQRTRFPARWIVVVLFFGILVPVISGIGFGFNRTSQIDTLKQDAEAYSREFAIHLSELQTLMSALLAIHYSGTDDNQRNLITITSQLQTEHPIIEGIGRFAHVPLASRTEFENSMQERGLYNFRIQEISKSGRQEAKPRKVSMPISSIYPMSPAILGLLGSDLAANSELFDELQRAARDNQSILIKTPDYWPATGRLLYFKPTYRGVHPPVDPQERIEQTNGGYLMIVNPQGFLAKQIENTPHLDVNIELLSTIGSGQVYSKPKTIDSGLSLDIGLQDLTAKNVFEIGTSKLTLELRSQVGILLPHLIYTLTLIAATGFCLLLGFLFFENRKRIQLERIRSNEKLSLEQEKAARTLDAISDAVVLVDKEARIQHANPAGEKLLKGSANSLTGEKFDELLPLRFVKRTKNQFTLVDSLNKLDSSERLRFELTTTDDKSSQHIMSATLTRIAESTNSDAGFTVILRDISAESRLRQELEYQANHDALTGCTNRHYFEKRLNNILELEGEHKVDNALLYLDLDQFKIVNDTAGHSAGDELLINLTSKLSRIIRDEDSLSRIGGDEFAILINNTSKTQALAISENILNAFDKFVFTHLNHSFPISASLGLVHFSETSDSSADVLAAADMACYIAKDRGRNQLFEFRADDEKMSERSDELTWLTRLRHALDNDLFQLFAQPLANLKQQSSITHFEFLLRLIEPNGSEVTPWQIIQAAERYGLMRDLDRWVIAHAIETISELDGYDEVGFSINLSGQSAADPNLIGFIKDQYQSHNIDPTRLCFEITETAAISNYSTAIKLIQAIQSLGSKVALDDFGSGLSSFGYLKTLPVDVLKIDGQFVRNLDNSNVDKAMVKAIQDVAVSMNLKTVAEYVENHNIVSVLEDIGIDYAQGFHIGKPLPLEQALGLADVNQNIVWPKAA